MAFGVTQELDLWMDATLSEDQVATEVKDVSQASEVVFWIENDSTSQDEIQWVLSTLIDGSDHEVVIDTEALASNGCDPGDAFGI